MTSVLFFFVFLVGLFVLIIWSTKKRSDGLNDQLPGQKIWRTKRHLPPAHYLLKVENFSVLSNSKKYESGVFEAGGYKWRMCLYPNGDEQNQGKNYISLYLVLAETNTFRVQSEVNVNFKLFIYNQVEDQYLTIEGSNGGVKHFHEMKTMWGFSQLLEIEAFKDPSNGYLIGDSCVFGAEVFEIKNTANRESISFVESPVFATFSWKIENVSSLNDMFYFSKVFAVGGKNWMLQIHPKGDRAYKGKYMSLYLIPSDWKMDSREISTYAEFKLRIDDQVNGNHKQFLATNWFSPPKYDGLGYISFISLEDLHKPSNGFILNDSLTVQVEFLLISETESKCFPEVQN